MNVNIRKKILIPIIAVLLLVLLGSMSYTTAENEYSVVKQFGKIVKTNDTAGLRFKAPFIQSVSYVPKSKQMYDLPASEVITSDKKTMIVDAYVIWQVQDSKVYTKTLNASATTAQGRIDVIVYNAIKTTISSMTQEELIASRDSALIINATDTTLDDVEINDMEETEAEAKVDDADASDESSKDDANAGTSDKDSADDKDTDAFDKDSADGKDADASSKDAKGDKDQASDDDDFIVISDRLQKCIGGQCDQYGISINSVKIKVLDLPDENKEAVYNRMITERNNIAAAYKAQGEAAAQIIRNTTDAEVKVMISEAQAEADSIVAEGEAEYMKTMTEAYNTSDKADFYGFSLQLDALKKSVTNGNTTVFLDSDSPIAEIFEGGN